LNGCISAARPRGCAGAQEWTRRTKGADRIRIRKSAERGCANLGWLQSHHTFSFADCHDPAHMGVGNLRVINEDRIAPGTGFATHGHRDMEIISYVLEGALAHKDSLGNGEGGAADEGVIRPGDMQRMSAGAGVRHSELHHDAERTTHFLQIWILPRERGGAPGYDQKHFATADKHGRLRLVASPDGYDGSVTVRADASVRIGCFDGNEALDEPLNPTRLACVHVARGQGEVNGSAFGPATAPRSTATRVRIRPAGATPGCCWPTAPAEPHARRANRDNATWSRHGVPS
jgi:redox-sensitive bicupin YhaK (pirin superfamily)